MVRMLCDECEKLLKARNAKRQPQSRAQIQRRYRERQKEKAHEGG